MSTHQRRPLILGNWKMNGDMPSNEALMAELLDLSQTLLAQPRFEAGLAVPAPYLFQAAVRLRGRGLSWGSQDVSDQAKGAYTGEVSVGMLQDFEASFSLVGHSERRARHAESDAAVAAKTLTLLQSGLMAVVCVGESLAERESGQAEAVVSQQVSAVLNALQSLKGQDALQGLVLAYEPIWAIGTGKTASAQDAQAMHQTMRSVLAQVLGQEQAAQTRILYGGSMKGSNAAELLAQPDIDGGLVGGAALVASEFFQIFQAADGRADRLGLAALPSLTA